MVFVASDNYIGVMAAFTVTGMTCNNCRNKVEATLKAVAPDIAVTLEPPLATTSSPIAADALNAALSAVGKYRVQALDAAPVAIQATWFKTYYPLLLVIGLIAVASFASSRWMLTFMGGFFTVFGAFKLLDVPAFANAYQRYDVVAKHFKPWGTAYPFVETALGLAFLFQFHVPIILWIALVLSVIGAVGVIQANLSKQTIQCACLGTVFNLPMSVVTLIEDLLMLGMAAAMLVIH